MSFNNLYLLRTSAMFKQVWHCSRFVVGWALLRGLARTDAVKIRIIIDNTNFWARKIIQKWNSLIYLYLIMLCLCRHYIVFINNSHGISRARCFLTRSFGSGRKNSISCTIPYGVMQETLFLPSSDNVLYNHHATNPCRHISCHRWHGFLFHALWIWHIGWCFRSL